MNIDEIQRLRVIKHRCETDLIFFARYFFKELYGQKFFVDPHHRKIANALKDIEQGGNLLINMPPRYGKTELAVVCWIAQSLARNPQAKFIHLSFSSDLALENSTRCRELVKSEKFQRFWPIDIKPDADSKAKWYTAQGGGLYATMAGGAVTGFGAGMTDPGDLFGGCFIGSTLITTERGKKRIDELTKDDIVLTYSHSSNSLEWERVIATQELKRNAIVKVTTHSGRIIYCTPCHRFYNGAAYELISSFNAGDRIISHTGENVLPVQSFKQPVNHMFDGLQKPVALSPDAWRWKLKLSGKPQRLPCFIQKVKALGKGKGWLYLCNLRFNQAPNSAPHRRSEGKQQGGEFDNTLSGLPHNTSQICYDTISSIEQYSSSETSVYDIQTERNHNFFAEGILVHNSIIIDDPLKPADARSEIERNKVNERLNNTIKSRRNNKSRTPIVIIMQRLHESDMSQFVLDGKMGETFKHLCLPAINEDGTALCPRILNLDDLKAMENNPEERLVYWSQYMQKPAPLDGEVYKYNWYLRHSNVPSHLTDFVHSWDTAYKTKEHNDPSACTVWAMDYDNNRALLAYVFNGKLGYPDLKKKIAEIAAQYPPSAVLIEDKASGQSLLQDLKQYTQLPVIPIKPEGDKLTRAVASSGMVEAGRISLPNNAPWLAAYETQLLGFPNTSNDDMVDSTSQFINWWRSKDKNEAYKQQLLRALGR